jgi:hypothetical protein
MDTCSYCCDYIDTDDSPECYVESPKGTKCICTSCQEDLITDGELIEVDGVVRWAEGVQS